jgi:membrane-associated HD superfamily phosphohydrolase
MSILNKILEVRGLKRHELTEEEKIQFDEWEDVLRDELTVENMSNFLKQQIKRLQKELIESSKARDVDKSSYLSARIENYEVLVGFVDEPERTKERLEKHLEELIKVK